MFRTSISLLLGLLAIGEPAPGVPVTLAGSPESMERQHRVAVESGYTFVRTTADLRRAVRAGELVPLRGGPALVLKHDAGAVARPEVEHFLDRFSADFRSSCGDPLVVTSLTRPRSRQPRNAHPLSVHPVGMAVDLRVPRSARCRKWLERTLLQMEEQGILDVTRERSPAHYHVALFPEPYLAHLGLRRPAEPRVAPVTVRAAEPVNTLLPLLPRR